MRNARFLFALLVVAGAALAACSGNFGAGTSAPNGLLPSGPLGGVTATASPTPASASNIVTYGDSTAFQPLPQAAGYGGAIAFEVPSPRPSGFQAIPIGATLAITAPSDSPNINLATPGKHGKKRQRPARALAYLSLLATRDITLASYPRIAIDVPRDVVTTYRVDEINLALYNSGANDKTYRLTVAEHDLSSPPPTPVAGRSAQAGPSPSPSAAPTAGGSVPPLPPSAAPSVSPTLPPQRILFTATATSLKLTANKAVVFAVYALPVETPSPAASASSSAIASPASSASAAGSASPTVASPSETGTPAGIATASVSTPAATMTPTASP